MKGLLLNVVTRILGCIFSMLLSDFKVCGLKSIPTLPMTALIEFFSADAVIKCPPIASIAVFYFYFALCSCMHTMSRLCSAADTVSSASWPILFKVLTLSVAICTMRLNLSNLVGD